MDFKWWMPFSLPEIITNLSRFLALQEELISKLISFLLVIRFLLLRFCEVDLDIIWEVEIVNSLPKLWMQEDLCFQHLNFDLSLQNGVFLRGISLSLDFLICFFCLRQGKNQEVWLPQSLPIRWGSLFFLFLHHFFLHKVQEFLVKWMKRKFSSLPILMLA